MEAWHTPLHKIRELYPAVRHVFRCFPHDLRSTLKRISPLDSVAMSRNTPNEWLHAWRMKWNRMHPTSRCPHCQEGL
jgi:hypothetical protein